MKFYPKLLNYRSLWLNQRFYHDIKRSKISASSVVDVRSDTVTKPSEGMRNAIRDAVVGDDVKEEDETVLELERRMAEITQKEDALFVASGTMGNLLSVLTHCSRRGTEVLLGNLSHIFNYEQGGIAQLGGVQPFIVPTKPDGTLCLRQLASNIRYRDSHCPTTELICYENTHGSLGGKVIPLKWIDEVASFAEERKLSLHVDGARIFNASIACGEPVARLLKGVHSASICFSKSLGAPVGTVVIGSEAFIQRVRRLRKAVGGGWRQAGILAAAGLYALDHNIERLKEDHDNAKLIARGLNELNNPNIWMDADQPETNIILLNFNSELISDEEFCQRLMEVSEEEEEALGRKVSVLASPHSTSSLRLVTHLGVSRDQAVDCLAKIKFVAENIQSS